MFLADFCISMQKISCLSAVDVTKLIHVRELFGICNSTCSYRDTE